MKIAPPSTARRALAVLPVAALIGGFLAGCSGSSSDDAPSASTTPVASIDPDEHVAENLTEFSYAGRDGSTALELLQENDPDAKVQGKGENAFVVGIRGREADESANEFWALYINDKPAEKGAGTLGTKDGQTVTWKLETFE